MESKVETSGQVERVKVMSLPVKLTEKELALRAQELATAERLLGEEERRLNEFVEAAKVTKKQIDGEISARRDDVRNLARKVRDRAEHRDVAIEERSDFEAWSVSTYRCDTGDLVTTRSMLPEERQRALFEQQKAKTDRAKRGETATA